MSRPAPLAIEEAAAAFEPTPAQRDIRSAVHGFLAREAPLRANRRWAEEGARLDRSLVARTAEELGVYGVLVPERHGGAGLTLVEAATILEEMGATLHGGAFLGSAVLSVLAIEAVGATDAESDLLAAIASAQTIASVALAEPGGDWTAASVATRAEGADGGTSASGGDVSASGGDAGAGDDRGWRLHGAKRWVLDGDEADVLLVFARAPAGLSLFAVSRDAPGLTATRLPTMDATRPLAALDLDGAPARLIGAEGAAEQGLDGFLLRASVALAAEQVGVAQACLDEAVAYARERVQFGRPIGSFQAIQHKCADMLIAVEGARSAAAYAAWAAAADSPELPAIAPLAKACCCDAAFRVAAQNVQIHGGIGFTWEADAHLRLKRAKSSQALLGSSDHHMELLAEQLGI